MCAVEKEKEGTIKPADVSGQLTAQERVRPQQSRGGNTQMQDWRRHQQGEGVLCFLNRNDVTC